MTVKTAQQRREMLPPALQSEVNFCYIGALSLDPANRISHCRNLIGALKIGIRITDEPELLPQLNAASGSCFTAQTAFSKGNWVKSNFFIDAVLDNFLGDLVHDGFGSLEEGAFNLPANQPSEVTHGIS